MVEGFEIKKDNLTQEQLAALEEKVWSEKIMDTNNLKEIEWVFYFNWIEISQEDFEIIESIHKNIQVQQEQVESMPNTPQTETSREHVIMHISSYNINTILWLYNNVDSNFREKIEKNILERGESNNFEQNKILLEKLKEKDTIDINIYEKVIFNVLKKLSSKEQGDELISLVWKEKIQYTIKNQVIIDDKFAEDFYYNYTSSDKVRGYSVNCKWSNDKVGCNAFSSYLFAMDKQTKKNNLNVLWPTLYKAFNEDLIEFKTWILESINKYRQIKWEFPATTHKTFQEAWLLWVLNELIDSTADKTNMKDWQKDFWKWLWWIWLWIWAIYGIFKFFQKTWWKWLLWLVWAEFWAQVTTWEWLLSIWDKLLNGWFNEISDKVKKTSQKWIDFGKHNESYREQMGNTTFVNMMLWDSKLKDINVFMKEKNWQLIFDAKKYIDSLKDNDWRKQILKWMWENYVSLLFSNWLNTIWIKEKDFNSNKTLNRFFLDYQYLLEQGEQWQFTWNWNISETKLQEEQEPEESLQQEELVSETESNWQENADNLEEQEIIPKEKQEVISYFSLDNKEILFLNEKLTTNDLDLDILKYLRTYKDYIEQNLSDFKYKDKIKKSIKRRTLELSSIIDERIVFVDEHIEEWDFDEKYRSKEIQNQRWIIDAKMKKLFEEIDNKILPSAVFYMKNKNTKGSFRENRVYDFDWKMKEIEDMFQSNILKNWKFDKTFTSFEIWDANTNNWDIFDISSKDSELLSSVPKIEWQTLLSKEDIEIQNEAQAYYIGYVLFSVVPYIWSTAAVPSDIADLIWDEEWVITILKEMWFIDKNYTMEKSYWDNIFGWLWLILTFFGLQWAARWKKLIKANSMLDKIWIWKVEDAMIKLSKKMWVSNENLQKLFDKLWIRKTWVYINSKWKEIEYKLWKDGKVETATYTDTWEVVSKQQISALNRMLNKKRLSDDIKTWKLNPEKLDNKEKSKLLSKLLWLWWKTFNKEFKSIFSWDKKEISIKLTKFVFTWNPSVKWESYNIFKAWNVWKWLWNIALTWGFAGLTWWGGLYDYYDSWTKINAETWETEFSFDEAILDSVDWEDMALNYAWYGVLNRFVWSIYAFDDIFWEDLGLHETELANFLKQMPLEWIEKASYLPWLWDNLKRFLERWFQEYKVLYESE